MEQIILNQKYLKFYQSVKLFLLKTNLAKEEHLLGVELDKINKVEKILNLSIPIAIRNYFFIMGKMNSKSSLIDNPFDNFLNVQERTKKIIDIDIKKYLLNQKYFFWEYDETAKSLLFSNSTIENPSVNMILDLDELDTDIFYSFTSFIRHRLFFSISIKFTIDNKNANTTGNGFDVIEHRKKEIKLENLIWAEFYYNFYEKFPDANRILLQHRDNFYKLIAEEEAQGNFLYSIDEFELKFIEYLKSKIEQ